MKSFSFDFSKSEHLDVSTKFTELTLKDKPMNDSLKL